MDRVDLSIHDLAIAAGVTPRAVRFYVQQKLIPPPDGAGRGSRYGVEHRAALEQVIELQRRGHSLDEIRRLNAGYAVRPPAASSKHRARPARLAADLWTRVTIAPGVELHFAGQHHPAVEGLLAIKKLAVEVFHTENTEPQMDTDE
jgi:DNA-binding transcriptional MerR regulator